MLAFYVGISSIIALFTTLTRQQTVIQLSNSNETVDQKQVVHESVLSIFLRSFVISFVVIFVAFQFVYPHILENMQNNMVYDSGDPGF